MHQPVHDMSCVHVFNQTVLKAGHPVSYSCVVLFVHFIGWGDSFSSFLSVASVLYTCIISMYYVYTCTMYVYMYKLLLCSMQLTPSSPLPTSPLCVRVIDATRGRPAVGVSVEVSVWERATAEWTPLGSGLASNTL